MLIDLTLDVTPGMIASARENEEKARSGHLGTHFDVMDRDRVRRQRGGGPGH